MRISLLVLALLPLGIAQAPAEPLQLDARPIESFGAGVTPDGPVEFLGGLQVLSDNQAFGGLSGIDMLDGENAIIIGDSGTVVCVRLVHENGRLSGLADAEIQSLFATDTSKSSGDVEDIALDPSDRSRGVVVRERQPNAMLAFSLAEGRPSDFTPRRVGADDRLLSSNKGLESVTYGPPGTPLAGEIVAIAERSPRSESDIPAWIAGVGSFAIVRRDNFDVSSARFLPDGDLILLERRYSPAWGISIRLRRIAGGAIALGARVDGELLLEAGMTSQIDNMEGLAVSQDAAGRTILTLVSDDNYSILQRTLILQFALRED